MPYEIAVVPIETALRALLVASAPLVALLPTKAASQGGGPAFYNDGEVPQGAPMPYVTIGAWTQVPFHSMQTYGWNCTCQIKVTGQKLEDPLFAIMSAAMAVLEHGQALTVTGYTHSWIDEFNLQPTLKSVIGGVTNLEVPAILRVFVS